MMNEESAAQAIIDCIDNAEDFLSAADVLHDHSKPRQAYLLTLYGMEELGKVPLVANAMFYSTAAEHKRWRRRFLNHQEKFQFSDELEDLARGIVPDQSPVTDHAETRTAIAYVGISNDEFVAPKTVSSEEAAELLLQARKRLALLRTRHPSLVVVRLQLAKAKGLEGLGPEKLKAMLDTET
jgi:AbiV family abortive infection protein